jgi:TatD DNase family protein
METKHKTLSTKHKLIDTHAHFKNLDQAKTQVNDAQKQGVSYIIAVGTDLISSRTAIQIANSITGVKAVAGIHPHEAQGEKSKMNELIELVKNENVAAVGECGLDYHYMHSPKESQREVFLKQLEISKKLNKPLVIHSREAMDDTLLILENEKLPAAGCVLHCFSGNLQEAQRAISLGCYLAFGGVITFKNASAAEVAAGVPLEKIILETDSPYLSPEPFRGKPNTPANIYLIAEKLAELKGVSFEVIAKETSANAKRFFKL